MTTAVAQPVSPQLREMDRRLLGGIALGALGDRPLPPRPSGAGRVPDVDWSWQGRAACRDATAADSEAPTEANTQTAGRPLAESYCAVCPVVLDCLTAGRATRATGVWGGVALDDGKLAPNQRRGVGRAAGRSAAALAARLTLLLELADGGEWSGRAGELVAALAALPGEPAPGERGHSSLARVLHRAAPAMRAAEIDVASTFGHGRVTRRHVRHVTKDLAATATAPLVPACRPPRDNDAGADREPARWASTVPECLNRSCPTSS